MSKLLLLVFVVLMGCQSTPQTHIQPVQPIEKQMGSGYLPGYLEFQEWNRER